MFIGYRWRLDGEVVFRLTGRCPIEFDLAPGAHTNALLRVTAPPLDGRYVLELDMVQEDVTWFGERGSETLAIPVVVGSGVGPIKPVDATPAPQATFRIRHPRASALCEPPAFATPIGSGDGRSTGSEGFGTRSSCSFRNGRRSRDGSPGG